MRATIKDRYSRSLIIIILTLLVGSVQLLAATRTSVGSGNWNNPALWSGGAVHATRDFVVIAAGTTVTINVNTAVIDDITIQAGAILRGDGTGKILVYGRGAGEDFTNNGTLNASGADSLILLLNRNSQWGGTGTNNCSIIDLNGRTLTFTNGVSVIVNLSGSPDPFLRAGSVGPSTTVTTIYNGTYPQFLP